jgi:hypothetical protein
MKRLGEKFMKTNNVNNNSYSKNVYESNNLENNLQQNQEPKADDIKAQTIKNMEYVKNLDSLTENESIENIVNKVKEELANAQAIAIKIVKDVKVTKEELDFLKEKFPDIKQTAEESLKQYKVLIQELEVCTTQEEIDEVISKATKEVSDMLKNMEMSQPQSKIKLWVIEDATRFSEKVRREIEKAESIALRMIRGEIINSSEEKFITENYPNIKYLVDDMLYQIDVLKDEIKSGKTVEEKEQLIQNLIDELDKETSKGLITKTELKIKWTTIKEIEKFFRRFTREMSRVEAIAIKITNNKRLTSIERRFMDEKYPDIKAAVLKEVKEGKYLNEALKRYESYEKKMEIISSQVRLLEYQLQIGQISQVQAKVRKIILEKIRREINIRPINTAFSQFDIKLVFGVAIIIALILIVMFTMVIFLF